KMIAQAAHIPVHLGSMPLSVAAAVERFDKLEPGDGVLLNDPYRGGTHLPDITLASPVFLPDSPILIFSKASSKISSESSDDFFTDIMEAS
ncbi:MAG: hydantoinase B/oxoprolinase family protein, partial [Clostridiales bacterium]|nr:hydantoinase B/oxoprolinase family protein [Clostridiales bacterium]